MTEFSICIPNFNYGRYLGETIATVLSQDVADLEVCVSDNASTDDSREVVGQIADERLRLSVNPTNVGFAPNLDRAGSMATGKTMIMLSSDDVMNPGALSAYQRLLAEVDPRTSVIGSAIGVIDADGHDLGRVAAHPGVWREDDRDAAVSAAVGLDVYSAPAGDILRRSVERMRNPFHFATFAYPRDLYERVGGYSGQRLVNPDKWFNWRILGVAERAYFVNADLFSYRWHDSNQTAVMKKSGALKFLVDEYAATFQLDGDVLDRIGVPREIVERAFVDQDIALRGLRDVANGDRSDLARPIHFARATYPEHARRSTPLWALRVARLLGPIGTAIARPAMDMFERRRARRESALHERWHP